MIEVIELINAVRRRVGHRTLDAGEAHSVIISQVYAASIDDVWDACTNPIRIPRWFLPVTGDLKPGGHYQIEGNASGTIERCDPPRGFTATWEFGGQISWIEVRLASEPPDGTRLELEHIADPGTPWAEFGPGAVGVGWQMALIPPPPRPRPTGPWPPTPAQAASLGVVTGVALADDAGVAVDSTGTSPAIVTRCSSRGRSSESATA